MTVTHTAARVPSLPDTQRALQNANRVEHETFGQLAAGSAARAGTFPGDAHQLVRDASVLVSQVSGRCRDTVTQAEKIAADKMAPAEGKRSVIRDLETGLAGDAAEKLAAAQATAELLGAGGPWPVVGIPVQVRAVLRRLAVLRSVARERGRAEDHPGAGYDSGRLDRGGRRHAEGVRAVSVFALAYWSVWLAMLVIGDPLFNWLGGEQYSDTHFLATYIPIGIRAGILGWLVYHFLVAHVKG